MNTADRQVLLDVFHKDTADDSFRDSKREMLLLLKYYILDLRWKDEAMCHVSGRQFEHSPTISSSSFHFPEVKQKTVH